MTISDMGSPAVTNSNFSSAAGKSNNDGLEIKAYFAKDLFTELRLKANTDYYKSSQPFPHGVIRPIFAEKLLRNVRNELLANLHFTPKETDIYKFHQSGDLANLDGLSKEELAKLPNVKKLRDAIYSQEFRDYIDMITGCGPLSGTRTDMSANIYKDGDHLLLHDDAIGDRLVSYILYMPDPDYNETGDWDPANGGALELYPREREDSWAPTVAPTTALPPNWNQMAFFIVKPGVSHHSVEEIASVGGKWRLSIQGWFHRPQPGEPGYRPDQVKEVGQATLKQIEAKESNKLDEKDSEFIAYTRGPGPAEGLGDADRECLSRYINPEYLDDANLQKISTMFVEESSLQLGRFLRADLAERLLELVSTVDRQDGTDQPRIPAHGTGEVGRWRAVRSPVLRRFLKLDGDLVSNSAKRGISASKASEELVAVMADLRDNLFNSESFVRWLQKVCTLVLVARRGMVRRFRAGLDYTLATPENNTEAVLDAVLCLAPSPNGRADEDKWTSGDVGGYECYLAIEDDSDDDASVYHHADEDTTLLTVPAGWNRLNIVLRDEGVLRFVKYISAFAPASRWDVAFEYLMDQSDDGDITRSE
ncbi:putative component of NuA3 histone acetyltransferase complex [Spiromyces aspiralis]|uniref:Component of NuA3 histone acetyltransferase complex n=1 Tax=Spiromyces aspiralis TaxID=68401 RepID=A0ACC1HXV4_9FUNG|nr:putative component of NuA3 histone acetyltransferase complex [Spiromyces aspiralis]